jgi:hypothetical protein
MNFVSKELKREILSIDGTIGERDALKIRRKWSPLNTITDEMIKQHLKEVRSNLNKPLNPHDQRIPSERSLVEKHTKEILKNMLS